jgi:hypothetical protein
MSALGQKQTSARRSLMSALPPKADIAIHSFQISRDECQPHSLPAAFIIFIGHFGEDRPPERTACLVLSRNDQIVGFQAAGTQR